MPDINNNWHYHDELELIYIKRGSGTQFMGDSISNFSDGDVLLAGSGLPHFWKFDTSYFSKTSPEQVDVYVVHFDKNFWGERFIGLPENIEIARVIEKAKRGIQLKGSGREQVATRIEKLITADGAHRVIHLMEALLETAACNEVEYVASFGYKTDFSDYDRDRINAIYNYTIANFNKNIDLKEIAEVARISRNSFCKFFKSRTGKTYFVFMNEIRIKQACSLLLENKLNIKEICYECGYNNFVSFHKFFKEITGITPLKYQKTHL